MASLLTFTDALPEWIGTDCTIRNLIAGPPDAQVTSVIDDHHVTIDLDWGTGNTGEWVMFHGEDIWFDGPMYWEPYVSYVKNRFFFKGH